MNKRQKKILNLLKIPRTAIYQNNHPRYGAKWYLIGLHGESRVCLTVKDVFEMMELGILFKECLGDTTYRQLNRAIS